MDMTNFRELLYSTENQTTCDNSAYGFTVSVHILHKVRVADQPLAVARTSLYNAAKEHIAVQQQLNHIRAQQWFTQKQFLGVEKKSYLTG